MENSAENSYIHKTEEQTPVMRPDSQEGVVSMTQFNDREKAFEAKFQKDQELQFKVNARRNRLLGMWAAEKRGISGDDAEAYAKEVVVADFESPGDDDVLNKVLGDLTNKGVETNEAAVRYEMDRLLEQAKREVSEEG